MMLLLLTRTHPKPRCFPATWPRLLSGLVSPPCACSRACACSGSALVTEALGKTPSVESSRRAVVRAVISSTNGAYLGSGETMEGWWSDQGVVGGGGVGWGGVGRTMGQRSFPYLMTRVGTPRTRASRTATSVLAPLVLSMYRGDSMGGSTK